MLRTRRVDDICGSPEPPKRGPEPPKHRKARRLKGQKKGGSRGGGWRSRGQGRRQVDLREPDGAVDGRGHEWEERKPGVDEQGVADVHKELQRKEPNKVP